jgi:hypothetical protein
MVITVYFVAQNPDLAEIQGGQDVPPELMAPVLAIGCSICGGGLLSILGLVLGIIGLVQPARLKLFAIIGTVLNGLIVGGGLLLLLVSLATSA